MSNKSPLKASPLIALAALASLGSEVTTMGDFLSPLQHMPGSGGYGTHPKDAKTKHRRKANKRARSERKRQRKFNSK